MVVKSHTIAEEIVREYDIRGRFGENLSEDDAYVLALKLMQSRSHLGLQGKVCVARDGRLSSPTLHRSLVAGFQALGAEVLDLGIVPTPLLYFAAHSLPQIDIAVMITGSHNPMEYNGFKIIFNHNMLFGEELKNLAHIDINDDAIVFLRGAAYGSITKCDLMPQYTSIISKLLLTSQFQVIWDPGNGAGSTVLQRLIHYLPGKHKIINGAIDGCFPSRPPDPSKGENLSQLINVMQELDYDFGIAFDGDADRIGVVDKNGRFISGGHLLYIFATDLVKRHKRPVVLTDMRMSSLILNALRDLGCEVVQYKTGHALIKAKMKEEGILLAAEMSGHIFFGEDYYGFDDAIFGACKFLNIVATSPVVVAQALNITKSAIPVGSRYIEADAIKKASFIAKAKQFFIDHGYDMDETDGIRINQAHGWMLIRASNTEDFVMLLGEAYDRKAYLQINKIFDDLIFLNNLVE